MRHRAAPRQPRPASIAITGVTHSDTKKSDTNKPPLPKTRKTSVAGKDKTKKKLPITSPTEGVAKPISSPTTETAIAERVIEKEKEKEVRAEENKEATSDT